MSRRRKPIRNLRLENIIAKHKETILKYHRLDEDPGSDEEPEWLKIHKTRPRRASEQQSELFIDNNFPTYKALGYEDESIRWLRPHQIVENPKLFVDGGSQFDVVQGEIGDCWFLSVASAISFIVQT